MAPRDDPKGMYAALVFPFSELKNTPMYWFGKRRRELRIAMKVLTGYEYDNDHLRVVGPFGGEFAFSVSRDRDIHSHSELAKEIRRKFNTTDYRNFTELAMWDHTGKVGIYNAEFTTEWNQPIPGNVLAVAEKRMKDYVRGFLACADCGKGISRDTKNVYFAGCYCDACWSGETGEHKGRGGWKKVEAEETYD